MQSGGEKKKKKVYPFIQKEDSWIYQEELQRVPWLSQSDRAVSVSKASWFCCNAY